MHPAIAVDYRADYRYGPTGEPVEQIALASSTPTYLTYTPTNSTWVSTNQASAQTGYWGYDAYGTPATGTPTSPFGYSGQYQDATTGAARHWRIAGIPAGACELMSKRSAEITAATASKGFATYQARGLAARDTRKAEGDVDLADLMSAWQAELSTAGHAPDDLLAAVDAASAARVAVPARLTGREVAALAAHALGPTGRLAGQKVFTRPDVIVAVAPFCSDVRWASWAGSLTRCAPIPTLSP